MLFLVREKGVEALSTHIYRIRAKYAIKNTTGYSINALADFQDPFEILKHLVPT